MSRPALVLIVCSVLWACSSPQPADGPRHDPATERPAELPGSSLGTGSATSGPEFEQLLVELMPEYRGFSRATWSSEDIWSWSSDPQASGLTVYIRDDGCVPLELERRDGRLSASLPVCSADLEPHDVELTCSLSIDEDGVALGSSSWWAESSNEAGVASHGCWGADAAIVEASDEQAEIGGECVRLRADCRSMRSVQQTCVQGGTRTCEWCDDLTLTETACNGFGASVMHGLGASVELEPVDCSVPCERGIGSELLDEINTYLDRGSYYASSERRLTLYRSLSGCEADVSGAAVNDFTDVCERLPELIPADVYPGVGSGTGL